MASCLELRISSPSPGQGGELGERYLPPPPPPPGSEMRKNVCPCLAWACLEVGNISWRGGGRCLWEPFGHVSSPRVAQFFAHWPENHGTAGSPVRRFRSSFWLSWTGLSPVQGILIIITSSQAGAPGEPQQPVGGSTVDLLPLVLGSSCQCQPKQVRRIPLVLVKMKPFYVHKERRSVEILKRRRQHHPESIDY